MYNTKFIATDKILMETKLVLCKNAKKKDKHEMHTGEGDLEFGYSPNSVTPGNNVSRN